jgi:CRISPR-associated protein Csd1
MILQRLAEHYDRINDSGDEETSVAQPGFSLQQVSFCVVLNPNGQFNSLQPRGTQKGKKWVGESMSLPGQTKSSGKGFNPCFLWDNSTYMLGYKVKDDNPARTKQAFESFRDLHISLQSEIHHPAFDAVCLFLKSWSTADAMQHKTFLETYGSGRGVFSIAGTQKFVHELVHPPTVDSKVDSDTEQAPLSGACLITGAKGELARLHKPEIKGVIGTRAGGVPLVSMNMESAWSYGKEQSYNAPVSGHAAFRYANALNGLLKRKDRRISLGDSTVVFWADHLTRFENCLSEFFSDWMPDASALVEEDRDRVRQARILLTQIRDGTAETELIKDDQPTKFFILGLAPNAKKDAARISMRLWIEADASELQERLGQHLRDIELVGSRKDEILTLWRIGIATGRWDEKKSRFDTDSISPKLAGDLARSVLTGAAYPQSLLSTMLRRIHSDGELAYARAAAIKACLVRNSRLRGNPLEVSPMLDLNSTDPAYCCGRAFALLEVIQKDSAGDGLNRTIKDSYFSSASTTPSLIFPRLCRLSQHHLAKLDTGHRIHREKQLGEVLNQLTVFPRLLSLEDQGKFVLGYFHQTKDIYTSKKDKEAKEEGDS